MFHKFKQYFIISFFLTGFTLFCQTENNFEQQHMKVLLRMVGHEFLLQIGDSSSQVLPIEKIEGRYRIQFERDFTIEPDLLSVIASRVFEKNNVRNGYIMEVEACDSNQVVYSLEYDPLTNGNLIPCKSRSLANDCYFFYFTILNNVPVEKNIKQVTSESSWVIYISLGFVIFVALMFLFRKKKKLASPYNSNWVSIGEYYFDKKNMKLIFRGVEEGLSGKESDLLELFYSNKNKTLEREYILNTVWNDEGDYIGRTLDVSVSKLRKRLREDSTVKIINIRGVGYRFVINS
jgi:hypothetical protein